VAGGEGISFKDDTSIREKHREELKEPEMFRVVLHNDHYTTQEFVVSVIVAVFHKTAAEATKIMLDVHRKGRGTVGVYPYDIAATKVKQVRELAKAQDFPLKCSIEKA